MKMKTVELKPSINVLMKNSPFMYIELIITFHFGNVPNVEWTKVT